ncbi:MAG: phosphate ABC transporter substrate-binding protein [Anaerolineae bacterium]
MPSLLAAVLFLVVLPACHATLTPPHPPVTIRVGGADAMQTLAHDLATAYHQTHPYATINIQPSNSDNALRQMSLGGLDLAFISRHVQADEITHRPARIVEIARDGIVLVVHPSNPLTALSRQQISQVYAGDIINWNDLKVSPTGDSSPIQVLSREGGSGTRSTFEALLMTGLRVTPTALVQSSERDILSYIATHPNAIGYISFSNMPTNLQLHLLNIDGIAPTLETIQSGSYPLMQSLYLAIPNDIGNDTSDFVDFIQSPQGQTVIATRAAPPQPLPQ